MTDQPEQQGPRACTCRRRVCRRVPDTGGRDDMAGLGLAWRGRARHGWLGAARRGRAWHGKAGLAWLGAAGLGRQGKARQGKARQAGHGMARRGRAWQGEAGMARGKKSVPVTTTPGPTNKTQFARSITNEHHH